jgi:hypothetical protein
MYTRGNSHLIDRTSIEIHGGVRRKHPTEQDIEIFTIDLESDNNFRYTIYFTREQLIALKKTIEGVLRKNKGKDKVGANNTPIDYVT